MAVTEQAEMMTSLYPTSFRERIVIERQESGMVQCRFYVNDFQVYEVIAGSIVDALTNSMIVMERLRKFPIQINGRNSSDQLTGRKVWYREIPAVIQDFNGMTGQVAIRPDNPEKVFPPEPWDVEDGDESGKVLYNGAVREDLLSPKIYWFRATDTE